MASICAHRARLQNLIVWLCGIYILEVCAVICSKDMFTISVSAVMLSDATFRKRLRDYVLTPIYDASTFAEKQLKMEELIPVQSRLPEHKNGIFVRFLPPGPRFSGVSSTKSAFLCSFCLRNPYFRAFRAQNRGFCAFFAFGTTIFGLFEHKIRVFVLFWPSVPPFSCVSSTKSAFLCAEGL